MAITYVGQGTVNASDTSSNPAAVVLPAGVQDEDVIIAVSPGTGGTGAHGFATRRGDEDDEWMPFNGLTSGYVGNVFNNHSMLWTRSRTGAAYTLGMRNYAGSGVSIAFRGLKFNSFNGQSSVTSDATASGTLAITSKTNTATSGRAMSLVIAHQFWSSSTSPFVHCNFDFSGHPELTACGSFIKTNTDYMVFYFETRASGSNWPALSVPFSNAQAAAFRNVVLTRFWTRDAADETAAHGV